MHLRLQSRLKVFCGSIPARMSILYNDYIRVAGVLCIFVSLAKTKGKGVYDYSKITKH